MTQSSLTTFPRIAAIALTICAGALWSDVAHATEATQTEETLQTSASSRSAPRGLNLLAEPSEGQPVIRVRRMGQGSWVCSPAGFGQPSRCYRN